MALRFGFYNSEDGDRKYFARDFNQLLDGMIRNGIFMSIGTCMMVTAGEGMTVTVGVGHAWFNQTWTDNDAPLPIEVPPSEILLDRIDTIVLEINEGVDYRANTIKLLKGTPSSTPVAPVITNNYDVHQYPLCDIYVHSEVEEIVQADITNRVGTSDTPFVTGILETINIDSLIAQWESEWELTMARWMRETDEWIAEEKDKVGTFEKTFMEEMEAWKHQEQVSFEDWFNNFKYHMTGDVAMNLQLQMDEVNSQSFNYYYGLVNKTTEATKNRVGKTTLITEVSDDGTAITTFEDTDTGKIITTKMTGIEGIWDFEKKAVIENIYDGLSHIATKVTETYTRALKSGL